MKHAYGSDAQIYNTLMGFLWACYVCHHFRLPAPPEYRCELILRHTHWGYIGQNIFISFLHFFSSLACFLIWLSDKPSIVYYEYCWLSGGLLLLLFCKLLRKKIIWFKSSNPLKELIQSAVWTNKWMRSALTWRPKCCRILMSDILLCLCVFL